MLKKFRPLSTWFNPLTSTGIFSPLASHLNYFAGFPQWPIIQDYNQFIKQLTYPLKNFRGECFFCVEQHSKGEVLEENYEYQIYRKNCLPMRKDNWHDFFNLLVWATFPVTKAQLNAWQVEDMEKHFPQWKLRSARQNKLAQFDESGMIMLSNDNNLLELIKMHQWHELFFLKRDMLKANLRPIIFGHALYEKNLQPYIGMTGKAILIYVEEEPWSISSERLDELVFSLLQKECKLYPFPLLGYPGWFAANEKESFYFNQDYFRI